MAVSSGADHRKWHFAGRKTVAEDFSENKDRGTGCGRRACPACDGHIRGSSTGRADFALQTCAIDRIPCGDVLVLSASGNKVAEKRK